MFHFFFFTGLVSFSIMYNSLESQPKYISNQSHYSEQEMSQFWREVSKQNMWFLNRYCSGYQCLLSVASGMPGNKTMVFSYRLKVGSRRTFWESQIPQSRAKAKNVRNQISRSFLPWVTGTELSLLYELPRRGKNGSDGSDEGLLWTADLWKNSDWP